MTRLFSYGIGELPEWLSLRELLLMTDWQKYHDVPPEGPNDLGTKGEQMTDDKNRGER